MEQLSSLSRHELTDRLKWYKKNKHPLTAPLTAASRTLLEELQRLIRSFPTERTWLPTEGPLSLVLSHSRVDAIHRLYQHSSVVRRIVDNRSEGLWRGLIERDYGLLPNFAISMKLYYLRRSELPIAGDIYERVDSTGFALKRSRENVIQSYGESYLESVCRYRSGRVEIKGDHREMLEPGEHIIDGSPDRRGVGATNIVTNRGRWLQVVNTNLPGTSIFNKLDPRRPGLVQVFDGIHLYRDVPLRTATPIPDSIRNQYLCWVVTHIIVFMEL